MAENVDQKFRSGYRSVFRFELKRDETAAGVAENYVRDWLRSRKDGTDQQALDDWDGTTNASLPSGANIDVTTFEDDRSGQNAIRYQVTDHVKQGRYRVGVSAMANTRRKSQVVFLIDVARDFGSADDVVAAVHPPRIVENILDTRRVFDGDTRLQGRPRSILSGDVDELLRAVADPTRSVPLLIAASVSPAVDEKWRAIIRALTRTATGTAAVFTVSAEAVDELNFRLPETLRVQRGHLRAVAPRVNMDNPVVRRHPLWTPLEIAGWLESDGRPNDTAVVMVAEGPRKRVLDAALPADIRRIAQLLDQEERRKELSRAVDERVAEVSLSDGASSDLVSETAAVSEAIFPRRAEVHGRKKQAADFWGGFRGLIARWLGKDPAEITEDTLETDLFKLDEAIIHDREALRINEKFLASVEQERDEQKVEISELKEENDSLLVQLEAANRKIDEAEQTIQLLQEQLEELSIRPAARVENAEPSSNLGDLQDKVQQVPMQTEDPHTGVGLALGLLAERLDPLLQATMEPRLGGRPWTYTLEWLDTQKGKEPGRYSRQDPAAQLRMLTERLGSLGFPFEVDGNRRVSNAAQQLRILRVSWGHFESLEAWDVTRAYDATCALLSLLGDDEGADLARVKRDAALSSG